MLSLQPFPDLFVLHVLSTPTTTQQLLPPLRLDFPPLTESKKCWNAVLMQFDNILKLSVTTTQIRICKEGGAGCLWIRYSASFIRKHLFITLDACVRGKATGFVCLSVYQHKYCQIWRSRWQNEVQVSLQCWAYVCGKTCLFLLSRRLKRAMK